MKLLKISFLAWIIAASSSLAQSKMDPIPPRAATSGSLSTNSQYGRPDRSASNDHALLAAQTVAIRLDKAFYETGDIVKASIKFRKIDPKEDRFVVFVVSGLKDVEAIVVKKRARGLYETERSNVRVATPTSGAKPHDGRLEAIPGDLLTGLVFLNQNDTPVGVDVVADLAIAGTKADKLPDIAVIDKGMSAAEVAAKFTTSPFGTLYLRGDPPVEFALGEVLFTPHGLYDLESFLAYSGGKVIGQSPTEKSNEPGGSGTNYLVKVPLSRARVDRLADLRNLFAENDKLAASQAGALQTAALIHEFRLKGFAVSANPRLQMHGALSSTEIGSGALTAGPTVALTPGATMISTIRAMTFAARDGRDCQPTNTSCPLNVPRLWAHMALWDLDLNTIPVAFIDQGFATANPDFAAGIGPSIECDFERPGAPLCGRGAANALPIVAASGVGPMVWHGTGSVSVAGGAFNNAWTPGGSASSFVGGTAGVAGQVMRPMLYRLGWTAYAFRTGEAIRRAVSDRAACINIPAGYPCNLRLTIVGDFDYCNPSGRAAACSIIIGATAAATAAASAAACATSGLFAFLDTIAPGVGSVLGVSTCATATAASMTTLVAATAACTALVAIGELSSPMRSAVDFATSRGVPVIASAGNQLTLDQLPSEVRPFVDSAIFSYDSDQFRIIPATLPNVISVGAWALTPAGVFTNSQLRGASVLLWAPEFANYVEPGVGAPLPTGPGGFVTLRAHGGTSSASSFITGVVATMQASNPSLNPNTTGLSATARANIVPRIRQILADTATQLGASTAEPARLPLVNPWAALKLAWGAWPAGYEDMLNFNDTGADDNASGARDIGPGEYDGTILTVPGLGGAATLRDTDNYRVTAGASSLGSNFRVNLRYPQNIRGSNVGQLELAGSGWVLSDDTNTGFVDTAQIDTRIKTYSSSRIASGSSIPFQIRGIDSDDNVYKITVEEFLSADRFDVDNSRNLPASRPNNNVPERAVPIGLEPAGELVWSRTGPATTGSYELTIPSLSFHAEGDVDWFVFRRFPEGSRIGGDSSSCERRVLSFRRNRNVEYRIGADLATPRVDASSGWFVIENPPAGLLIRASRSSGERSTGYNAEFRYETLLLPRIPGSPCS